MMLRTWDRVHCQWIEWRGSARAWLALPRAVVDSGCVAAAGAAGHLARLPRLPQLPWGSPGIAAGPQAVPVLTNLPLLPPGAWGGPTPLPYLGGAGGWAPAGFLPPSAPLDVPEPGTLGLLAAALLALVAVRAARSTQPWRMMRRED